MTWKQMIEFCQLVNPNRGEAYIRTMMNLALDEFARKTKMLHTSTTAVMDTNTTTFALPADLIEVKRVKYPIDTVTTEIHRASWDKFNLYEREYVWWNVGRTMFLGYVLEQVLTGVDGTFTIEYIKKFTHLVDPADGAYDLDTEPDVPLEFRRGICARIREDMANDPQVISREHAFWMRAIRDGIEYAQHNADGTPAKIIVHEL